MLDRESRALERRGDVSRVASEYLRKHDYPALVALLLRHGEDPREQILSVLKLPDQNIPPEETDLLFLRDIHEHDRQARMTLDHYELVQPGDVPPPDEERAIQVLFDDLRQHPEHVQAIRQMRRPVYQLIPVYEPEGPGFQRMVNAIDAHRLDGQNETFVWDESEIAGA